MPQVKPQRGARDPPYPPPGQFQAPAAYKAASSRPGRAKARTWVRPQSAEQSTPVSDPTPAPIQVAQQTVGSFISSLSKSVQVNQTGVASTSSQQASHSRGTVLAKHLLSVRSLKRARRPALTVRQGGIAKPGKLQRIDGVLYKVGGSGLGRSLQRQVTPKAVRPLLSPEGAYVRQGKHLILRSMLTTPKAVIQRVSTARSRPSSRPASANISGRQKLAAARIKRPSRLSKSSKPVQTHCLVFCRTGGCREHQAGKCHLVHDPATVAVCSRWLQGSCTNTACLLQHRPCPDVMPVCTFYLQGLCTTEECPYAHVKVDPNAPVCQEFVSGHCPRGVSCTKKHLTPRMIRQLRQSKALQADSCTSQQSKATVAQAHAAEAGQSVLQDEDLDLRPAFLR
ncbi:TPA: hypothetical protein ACH3X3_014328 [Trebouxia sp. C0006]